MRDFLTIIFLTGSEKNFKKSDGNLSYFLSFGPAFFSQGWTKIGWLKLVGRNIIFAPDGKFY